MSTKEFLYRYKDVEALETKTMVQKNVKDHRKDLNAAIVDVFKSDDEITIVSSDKKAVTFNKSLLILFSKSMRNCLATFSCCSFPTIFLPDCSAESVIKVHDILVKQVTKAGIKSFKDIHTVVETAAALGIDISDLQFGASAQTIPASKRPVIVDVNLSDEEDEADDTIQEIGSLESMLDSTYGNKEQGDAEPPRPDEYDVSSDDSTDDEDDKESDNDDGSSSDGEVDVEENEAKTVSESVSTGKTLVNETLFSEDDNSDDESENDKANNDSTRGYEKGGDISDEENIIENTTNFEISGIAELNNDGEDNNEAEDTIINTSAASEVIDEVLHFNKKFLQSERSKLKSADPVPTENIKNVKNSLESLKGFKNIIDGKLDDLLGDQKHLRDEGHAPLDLTNANDIDINEEPSPLKDEINLPPMKDESPEEKKVLIEGNYFENRFRCTICQNVMRKLAVSTFKEHYSTAHFQKEIFEMYIRDTAETVCRIEGCGKDFGERNRNNLVRHIGSTHNKSVEILQLKGMEVPMVFSENNKRKRSDVKFEKMSKIKTELEENTSSHECEMCGLYYSSKSNLERHLYSKHP